MRALLSTRHGSRGSSRQKNGLLKWDEKVWGLLSIVYTDGNCKLKDRPEKMKSHTERRADWRLDERCNTQSSGIIPEEDDARSGFQSSRMATAGEQVESGTIKVGFLMGAGV